MEKAKDLDIFYTIDMLILLEKLSKIIAESSDCVEKIITISNCLKEVPTNKKLCLDNPIFYYTACVHPRDVNSIKNISDLDIINIFAYDIKFVAVGELDYNRMFSPKKINPSI